MSIDLDRVRLSQEKMLEFLRRDLKLTDMITVFQSDQGDHSNRGVYCALIPTDQIQRALSKPSWELMHGGGLPGASERFVDGEQRVEYLRFGDESGVEPLVIDREFYGIRDDYTEISEEFRLFHNLYHDRKADEYVKIDDAGNEATVAVVEPGLVQIRLKEIRQFLAVREMHLSIQFDCTEHSAHWLEELEVKKEGVEERDDLMLWRLDFDDLGGFGSHKAFSRLLGKRLIEPLPKSKSGFGGFAEETEEEHVEFIVDLDENGEETFYTCNPNALANYYGANPGSPHYLTPVHFRKQVLDKYYQEPSKYSVEDSELWCGSLWTLRIDNHHDDKVCVWLGDLGRDLPYQERLHWMSHNIPPQGQISETFFRRQILARPTNSARPEHLFLERYQELREESNNHLGWLVLQPLHRDDQHHLQGLRVPATEEQRDFDELILSLTKILIDSLHVKRLNSLLSDEQKEGLEEGSIARLEAVLSSRNVQGAAERIAFLRKLQSIRSGSSVHRKGRKYKKITKQFDIGSQNLQDVFAEILWQAVDFLDFLVFLVRSGRENNVEENKIEEGYAILSDMIGSVDSGATDGSANHDDLIYGLRSKP